MRGLRVVWFPLLMAVGCTSGQADFSLGTPPEGGALIRFAQTGQELSLASAPLKADYAATYPNPRKLSWLEAQVTKSGKITVACQAGNEKVPCSESPLVLSVSGQSTLKIQDLYGKLLAELPFTPDCEDANTPKPGTDSDEDTDFPSDKPAGVTVSLEELGTTMTQELCEELGKPPGTVTNPPEIGGENPGTPTTPETPSKPGKPSTQTPECIASLETAKEELCKGVNAKLAELKLGYVYDCEHLDEDLKIPSGKGGPEKGSPGEDIGCRSGVIQPVLDVIKDKYKDTVNDACGPATSVEFNVWKEKIRLELYGEGVCGLSPLVLDLAGNGIDLSSLSRGVSFDLLATGTAVSTAWIRDDDAFLVRDLNGNGFIDSASEMFGNRTGGQRHPNGFAALAALDSDGNDIIDARDPAFAELRVWADARRDGMGPLSETLTLPEAGIRSLSIRAEVRQGADAADGKGNWIPYVGSFTRENGQKGEMVDAFLRFERRKRMPKRLASASSLTCHEG